MRKWYVSSGMNIRPLNIFPVDVWKKAFTWCRNFGFVDINAVKGQRYFKGINCSTTVNKAFHLYFQWYVHANVRQTNQIDASRSVPGPVHLRFDLGGEKHWGGIIDSSYLVLRSSALIKTVWVHCEWRISVHTLYSIRCCQWIHNPASGVAKTDTLLWAMTAQQLSKLFCCRKCCYDIAKDDTSEFMTFDESAFTTLRTVVKLKHYAYGEGLY